MKKIQKFIFKINTIINLEFKWIQKFRVVKKYFLTNRKKKKSE